MTDVQDAVRELERTGVVQTTNGPVRGYREDVLQVFKGLRYGAAPIGPLRFQPPKNPRPGPRSPRLPGSARRPSRAALRREKPPAAARTAIRPRRVSRGPTKTVCSSMSGRKA